MQVFKRNPVAILIGLFVFLIMLACTGNNDVSETKKAAEQGDAEAQFRLGQMYRRAEGLIQDYNEAINWYTKAAEQGDAEAQFNLGYMYYHGEGVTEDNLMAHMWFNVSAANGHENAADMRRRTAELMTPEQIAEAQKFAKEWMEKHRKE